MRRSTTTARRTFKSHSSDLNNSNTHETPSLLPETVQQQHHDDVNNLTGGSPSRRKKKTIRLKNVLAIKMKSLISPKEVVAAATGSTKIQPSSSLFVQVFMLISFILFISLSTYILLLSWSPSSTSSFRHPHHNTVLFHSSNRNLVLSELASKSFTIIFPAWKKSSMLSSVIAPPPLESSEKIDATHFDHGGLDIKIIERDNRVPQQMEHVQQRRVIYHNFHEDYGYERLINNPNDDDWNDYYYAFDDDVNRNPVIAWDDQDIQNTKHCRRTNWHRNLYINCNNLHEFDIQYRFRSGDTKYLNAGAYREVYLANLPDETLIFKAYYWGSDFGYADFEYMRMDAIVNERLSWSDRIVQIYAYCGTGMINEAMVQGDMETIAVPTGDGRPKKPLCDEKHLDVRNTLSGTKKLEYALDMAEAVLLLHSYPDGVIVHDDIQLSQFLLSENGKLKLNDFNRAEIMLYDEENQEYCGYRNNPGHGDWRAPEEYYDKPLDEKIDIWSLGNNFYSLLTGVYPFYDTHETKQVQKRVKYGETAYIDPRYYDRSFAEAKLADIIPKTWIYHPNERIDIFELVNYLREAVEENKKQLK